jgi:ribosomal protein S18 acetylase RimI-like enzyme
MVSFREAGTTDYENIARLHATRWQENYRGSFSDHFLDVEVLPERLAVWKERCFHSPENRYIVLAEEDGMLLAFCCAYVNKDAIYSTYLDNLHVSVKANGKGLGTLLMHRLINEIRTRNGASNMYIWVLQNNKVAIDFYDKLKGSSEKPTLSDDIGERTFW